MRISTLTRGAVAVTTALALTACGAQASTTATVQTSQAVVQTVADGGSSTTGLSALDDDVETHAQADDVEYDAAEASTITLADDGSTAESDAVEIAGSTVTITAPGTYVISGELSDGQLVVDSSAEGKVRLVLDGAQITSTDGSAIVVSAADEAVIVLAEGSDNLVADGSGYDTSAEDAPNAAIFSMADLTIGGTGSLEVTGSTNDGISSKDGLVVLGGTITVDAVDDGIRGKDYLDLVAGTVTVDAGGDGLKADNESDDTVGYIRFSGADVTVHAGDDGAHAEGDLVVAEGGVTIDAVEGLEGAVVAVTGGATTVTASDDGVNASSGTGTAEGQGGPGGGGGMTDDGSLVAITGGTLTVDAEGDGIDSNGSLLVTGGTTTINGPSRDGNGAIDANGTRSVSGGTLVAGGSAGMAEAFDTDSEQGWVQSAVQVEAGQVVEVRSGDDVLASLTATKSLANVVASAPGMTSGTSYTITVDGTEVATATAGQSTGGGMGGPGGGMGPRH